MFAIEIIIINIIISEMNLSKNGASKIKLKESKFIKPNFPSLYNARMKNNRNDIRSAVTKTDNNLIFSFLIIGIFSLKFIYI